MYPFPPVTHAVVCLSPPDIAGQRRAGKTRIHSLAFSKIFSKTVVGDWQTSRRRFPFFYFFSNCRQDKVILFRGRCAFFRRERLHLHRPVASHNLASQVVKSSCGSSFLILQFIFGPIICASSYWALACCFIVLTPSIPVYRLFNFLILKLTHLFY